MNQIKSEMNRLMSLDTKCIVFAADFRNRHLIYEKIMQRRYITMIFILSGNK